MGVGAAASFLLAVAPAPALAAEAPVIDDYASKVEYSWMASCDPRVPPTVETEADSPIEPAEAATTPAEKKVVSGIWPATARPLGGSNRASPPRMLAAPDIAWQKGTVTSNIPVARGTHQITIRAEASLAYQPGHILGFGLAHPETGEALKGPYTVTRQVGSDSFDIIYRIVPEGRKTPFMESLKPGDDVTFGGRFGLPIAEGIAEGTSRVVGIATGAGIGPLLGFAEAALEAPDGPEIELYCGYRDLADVCCADALDALSDANPGRFTWTACLSRPMVCTAVTANGGFAGARVSGRVTSAVPPLLKTLDGTHFHLVGNGEFVKEFKEGCLAAGVNEERVTTETYFNGKAEANPQVVDHVATALRGLAATEDLKSSEAGDEDVAVVSMG